MFGRLIYVVMWITTTLAEPKSSVLCVFLVLSWFTEAMHLWTGRSLQLTDVQCGGRQGTRLQQHRVIYSVVDLYGTKTVHWAVKRIMVPACIGAVCSAPAPR